jgi:hypothetical protein
VALPVELTPAQAESATAGLVAGLWNRNYSADVRSRDLWETLAALAAKLTPNQAGPAVDRLVAAIKGRTDTDLRSALGNALAVLVAKLLPAQVGPAADRLVAAIRSETIPDQLRVLGKVLATLATKLSDDQAFAALVFEILKYPNIAQVRSAEDILLEAVRTRFKDRGAPAKEKGFWAMVKWAQKQFPDLDLKSPPKKVSE